MNPLKQAIDARRSLVQQFSAAALAKLGRLKTKDHASEPKKLAVCSPERWEEITGNDPSAAVKLVVVARNVRLFRAWKKSLRKEEENG